MKHFDMRVSLAFYIAAITLGAGALRCLRKSAPLKTMETVPLSWWRSSSNKAAACSRAAEVYGRRREWLSLGRFRRLIPDHFKSAVTNS